MPHPQAITSPAQDHACRHATTHSFNLTPLRRCFTFTILSPLTSSDRCSIYYHLRSGFFTSVNVIRSISQAFTAWHW